MEPNWANSATLPTEMWKNRLIPQHERLEIADGAVHFRDQVIENLRAQLADLRDMIKNQPCSICGEGVSRFAIDDLGLAHRVCDTCTSDFAGAREMRYNKENK